MIEQPFDRSLARPCDAIVHFLHLFGNMNVDRRIGQKFCCKSQLIRRHSTQAVRGYAKHGTIETDKRLLAAFD